MRNDRSLHNLWYHHSNEFEVRLNTVKKSQFQDRTSHCVPLPEYSELRQSTLKLFIIKLVFF